MKVMLGIKNHLEGTANWVVRIVGGSIFAVLSFYAFRYTHYMIPRQIEKAEVMKDTLWHHILCFIVFFLILYVLQFCDKKIKESKKRIISWCVVAACMIWIAAAGLWWISSADRVPEADQWYLCVGASCFIDGEYYALTPQGGYFAIYPHQLPLVSLLEGLFRIVGQLNYYAYQVFNVCFTAGIVLLGYLFVREVSKGLTVAVTYAILMANCFPIFFYTNWVYGEIPCLFFTLLASWTLMKYSKSGKGRWLFGVVFGLTMAMVTRKNATIMVVAFCLVGVVYAIYKKNLQIFVAMIAAVVLPALIYSGVSKMYEVRSGHEPSKGMPASLFLELGLHESSGRYGWDDMSALELSSSVEYDWEKADMIARERIAADIEKFKSDWGYTKLFFREKVLSQWNNPLFQSLFFSANYRDENMPQEGTFVHKISHDYFMDIVKYSNYVQILVFIGTCFYFIFAVKTKSNILQHFLAVALIGGFLFCIIWEAKGRYMFPYYISMFPLAVIGYYSMLEQANKFKKKV